MTDWTDIRADEHLDSRDLIEALEGALEDLLTLPADEQQEATRLIEEIKALAEQGIEDWEHGAHLIREDVFVDYAQELAEDIGFVGEGWPGSYIDWEGAAQALKQDYIGITFLGADYLVRS
jgi:hypothetical protein